ncbi:MAG: hypothetical protein JXB48_16430 [Candidatus Latescibacteria bacterium]|nr:hypothetical protein [Candidatus Latescibacterota bacterium]
MNCEEFWKIYEDSGITPEGEDHLLDCPGCRKELRAEKVLMNIVQNLPEHEAPDTLWARIEGALPNKQIVEERERPNFDSIIHYIRGMFTYLQAVPFKPVCAACVIMLMSILATRYYYTRPLSPEDRLLKQDEIAYELEQKEQDYIAAIDKLSKLVENKKSSIDPELYDLYREKIALLDDYILQCRDALEQNESNTNVRTYLALAYKEKAETLQEMYELIN